MLIGEYHHNIDDKNRLILPAKFREEISDKFILTRGLDGCLFIYSLENWEKIVEQLKKLPFTKKDARTFMRFFLSGAIECELDKQGRVSISSSLIEHAKIKKECVVIGVNDRLEIWSLDKFLEHVQTNEEELSDIAEKLFDTNFGI